MADGPIIRIPLTPALSPWRLCQNRRNEKENLQKGMDGRMRKL